MVAAQRLEERRRKEREYEGGRGWVLRRRKERIEAIEWSHGIEARYETQRKRPQAELTTPDEIIFTEKLDCPNEARRFTQEFILLPFIFVPKISPWVQQHSGKTAVCRTLGIDALLWSGIMHTVMFVN